MKVFIVLNKEKLLVFLTNKPRREGCLHKVVYFLHVWPQNFCHACVTHIILTLIFINFDRDFTRYKSVVLPVVKRKMATIRRPRDIESR